MNLNFKTSRLLLSILSEDDWDFIQELVNTKGWLEFIGDKNINSKEDSIAYINKISNDPSTTYWTVRLQENNMPIGVVSFIKRDYLEHHDIGFAFLPNYQANGYAFESVKAVLLNIFQQADYPSILATTFAHNDRSIKLLQRLGLQFSEEIERPGLKLHVYSADRATILAL